MAEQEEVDSQDLEDLLADLKIPPRGGVAYNACTWERAHEVVYIVQVATLDDVRNVGLVLTTVLLAAINDAEANELDFDELLEDAREMIDRAGEAPDGP